MATVLDFHGLSRKITDEIALQLSMNKLNIAETLALLKILGVAETLEELKRLVRWLTHRFPFLKIFSHREKEQEKLATEEKWQKIIALVIKENPALATTLSKHAIKQNVSLDELVKKYPESKKYI